MNEGRTTNDSHAKKKILLAKTNNLVLTVTKTTPSTNKQLHASM